MTAIRTDEGLFAARTQAAASKPNVRTANPSQTARLHLAQLGFRGNDSMPTYTGLVGSFTLSHRRFRQQSHG